MKKELQDGILGNYLALFIKFKLDNVDFNENIRFLNKNSFLI